MKIQYCADLHLEFPENKEFLARNPLIPLGDILLLAGDIVPFKVMNEHNDFFDFVSEHFRITYWIPGNHEYYHSNLASRKGSFTEKIRENVLLLNNTAVIHQGIRFILSSLWTKISPENEWNIQQRLNDFRIIRYKEGLLLPSTYNDLHLESLAFLQKELIDTGKELKIVVTHHVPTLLNYPEKYRGDSLNEAFAVELHDLILESGPAYWIYGHHHSYVDDFRIGSTNVLTNQLGYVRHNEHTGFSNNKHFETIIDDSQYNKGIFAQ